MLDRASGVLFHLLAQSTAFKKVASRVGMRTPTSFARRFIAGETVAEAIEAARVLERRGLLLTLDLLGESVTSREQADAATGQYVELLDAVIAARIERNLSLKLTQIGLDIDRATAIDNVRRILERAEPAGFFVRIDMESSIYTEVTLEIFETLWHHGYRQIGIVLQAALLRSELDLQRINALGARVRLVKGAYRESKGVAHRKKADVDAAYARMLKVLLTDGHYPAIATHDPAMIDLARRWAKEHAIAPNRFEFQMLYGIRRDLQASLLAAGYRVRVYVPFGREWFPYFMRRLGEQPANITFVIRALLGESR
jgi:proline dehydrogenase